MRRGVRVGWGWRCAGAAAVSVLWVGAGTASADVYGAGFEHPVFSAGSVAGQDGWTQLDAGVDASVVDAAALFGPGVDDLLGFGAQALRVSNAHVPSPAGGWILSRPVVDEAGEATATVFDDVVGLRQRRLDVQLRVRSATGAEQAGLSTTLALTDRAGHVVTQVVLRDTAAGIAVDLVEVPGEDAGNPGHAEFVTQSAVAMLSYGQPHTLRLTVDYVAGPAGAGAPPNDMVELAVDGASVATGTSWEWFYVNDPGHAAAGNRRSTANRLGVVPSGAAAPGNLGNGYVIDNVRLESSGDPTGPSGPAGPQGPEGPAGPAGTQGPPGEAGAAGGQGPVGPQGPEGPVGPQGVAGPEGGPGATGPAGPEGPAGPAGPSGGAGAQGAVGPQGPAGPSGPPGAQGSQGAAGPDGLPGDQGLAGPRGVAGPMGAQGAVGPQGPMGPEGGPNMVQLPLKSVSALQRRITVQAPRSGRIVAQVLVGTRVVAERVATVSRAGNHRLTLTPTAYGRLVLANRRPVAGALVVRFTPALNGQQVVSALVAPTLRGPATAG